MRGVGLDGRGVARRKPDIGDLEASNLSLCSLDARRGGAVNKPGRLASPPAPAPPRAQNAPPPAWERSLIADFVDLRTRLAVLKARGVGAKANARLPVPRLRDARAWHAFRSARTSRSEAAPF